MIIAWASQVYVPWAKVLERDMDPRNAVWNQIFFQIKFFWRDRKTEADCQKVEEELRLVFEDVLSVCDLERERERESVCVCVCVCVSLYV